MAQWRWHAPFVERRSNALQLGYAGCLKRGDKGSKIGRPRISARLASFQTGLESAKGKGDAFLKLEDFDALLMCVCDGGIGPWGFKLERLRREAVVVGSSDLGFLRLIRISDYALGEECLINNVSG